MAQIDKPMSPEEFKAGVGRMNTDQGPGDTIENNPIMQATEPYSTGGQTFQPGALGIRFGGSVKGATDIGGGPQTGAGGQAGPGRENPIPPEAHQDLIDAKGAAAAAMGSQHQLGEELHPDTVKAILAQEQADIRNNPTTGQQALTMGYNIIGPGMNLGLAEMLGAPMEALNAMGTGTSKAVQWGLRKIGLGSLADSSWLKPVENPIGGVMSIRRLAGKLDISTTPDESTAAGYMGSKIGQFLGSSVPFTGAVSAVAKGLKAAEIASGQVSSSLLYSAATKPARFVLTESGLAAQTGLRAGIGGEATGREDPETQAMGELLGAFFLGPPIAWAEGGLMAGGSYALRKGKALLGISQAESEQAAGRMLAEVEAAGRQPGGALGETLPGSQVMTGAQTGNLALQSLTSYLLRKSAELRGRWIDAIDASQRAIEELAARTGEPNLTRTLLEQLLLHAMEQAKTEIAALVPGVAQTDLTAAKEQMAIIVRQELMNAERIGAAAERIMWGKVDLNRLRSVAPTRDLYNSLKEEFESDPVNLTPAGRKSFPYDLERLLFGQDPDTLRFTGTDPLFRPIMEQLGVPAGMDFDAIKTAIQQGGLSEVSKIGSINRARSIILKAIRDEQGKAVTGVAPDLKLLSTLNKIQKQLLEDMGGQLEGEAPDQALIDALGFSKQLNQTLRSDTVGAVLAKDKRLAPRVGEAETLDQFLTSGMGGADTFADLNSAAETANQARQVVSGTPGGGDALLEAAKTYMRLNFRKEVAPDGFVVPSAYKQFMDKFGAMLNHMPDIKMEFQRAAAAEDELGNYTKMAGSNVASTRQARFELFADNPVGVTMTYATESPNQAAATKQVIAMLQRDPTGNALKGFQAAFLQKIMAMSYRTAFGSTTERITATGSKGIPALVEKYSGVIAALDRADPGFASRVEQLSNTAQAVERMMANPGDRTAVAAFEKATMKMGFLGDMIASLIGAKGGEKIAHGGLGSSLLMATRGAGGVRDWVQKQLNIGNQKMVEAITNALSDKSYFDQITRDYRTPATAPSAFYGVHSFFLSMGLPYIYGPAQPIPTDRSGGQEASPFSPISMRAGDARTARPPAFPRGVPIPPGTRDDMNMEPPKRPIEKIPNLLGKKNPFESESDRSYESLRGLATGEGQAL